MFTVAGIAMVVFASIGLFMQQISKERKRLSAMGEFHRLLLNLAKRMDFTGETLPMIFHHIAEDEQGEAGRFAGELAMNLSEKGEHSLSVLWQEKVSSFAKRLFFRASTAEILKMVGKTLGTQSEEEEIRTLKHAAAELEEEIKKEKESAAKSEKLLKSGGVLLGLFIVILFL